VGRRAKRETGKNGEEIRFLGLDDFCANSLFQETWKFTRAPLQGYPFWDWKRKEKALLGKYDRISFISCNRLFGPATLGRYGRFQ